MCSIILNISNIVAKINNNRFLIFHLAEFYKKIEVSEINNTNFSMCEKNGREIEMSLKSMKMEYYWDVNIIKWPDKGSLNYLVTSL